MFVSYKYDVSVSEIYTYLAIECPSRLLEAEVIVERLVGKVSAFKRKVISPVCKAIRQCRIMGELRRDEVFIIPPADDLRIVGEAMQILVIVGEGQYIPLAEKVVPEERYIHIGKLIGNVRHTGTVGQVLCRRAYLGALPISHIHLREVSAKAQPFSESITEGDVEAFRLYFAIVDIGCCLFSPTQIRDVALDIILRIAIDKPAFEIEGMASERFGIAEIEVHVIAILWADTQFAHLQVLVSEHLLDSRQAISLLVG